MGSEQHSRKLNLYLRHRAELIDYATPIVGDRALAEDVVQDAWLRFSDAGSHAAHTRLIRPPLAYLYLLVRTLPLPIPPPQPPQHFPHHPPLPHLPHPLPPPSSPPPLLPHL